jgi:ribosome maturation factor RimP
MISKEKIENIVNEYLNGKEIFLVSVKITKNNNITVAIDGDKGVIVDDCVSVSKEIESEMNRDEEDFELTVTSFGLEESFNMIRQYKKNVGETVEVSLLEGEKVIGVLKEADDEKIIVEKKVKKETEQHSIPYKDINKTKLIIKF